MALSAGTRLRPYDIVAPLGQDAIFFDQVNGVLLPPIEPAGQRREQEVGRHRVRHGARVYTKDRIQRPKTLGRAMRHYGADLSKPSEPGA